ncbi:MAG: cell division protein ZapE [Mesorhizobium sp.]
MHLRDGLTTHPSVAQRYGHLVEQGELSADPAQLAAAAALDVLIGEIAAKRLASKSSALGWLFGKSRDASPLRGLYIHGGVGRGKTMLMDMFFALVPVRRKRRVHFNAFMAEVHDRIQKHRQARKDGSVTEDDPIPPVARALARQAWVLFFDEFAVTDIADAMVLSRLFESLFKEGVVLVATSNVAPDDLYRDGLNRQLFLPFVSLLKRYARILALDALKDYRQEKLDHLPVYLTPLGPETDRRMDDAWQAVTHGLAEAPAELHVMGRVLAVPRAAGSAARLSFAELCERPLGARDYLALADAYDTLFVDRVPVLPEARRNEAKRFILLVDTIYDRKLRLVMSAEAAPEALYQGRRGNEAFEFQRTASRLVEMRSQTWLDAWAARRMPARTAAP